VKLGYATRKFVRGVNRHLAVAASVGAILGQDSRSTQRYAHLATRTLNAAILKVK
jgi:hypothetical protein